MKKTWLVVWCALIALLGCAQTDPPSTPAPNSGPALEAETRPANTSHLLLWRVHPPGSSSAEPKAYLLGSIHVASSKLYPLDERIEAAFSKSDRLVLETDPSDPRAAELMAKAVQDSLLPKGQSIYEQLDPAVSARLKARFEALGADPERFSGFRLWLLSMTLSMLELDRAGFTGENGIDAHFQRLSTKRRLPLSTLEPLEAQIELLMSMGSDATAQDLALALDTDTVAELERMTNYWKQGNAEGLAAELEEMRVKAPLAHDALFTQRNRRMATELQRLLTESGSFFVVIGAGHLVGKGSVVDELRAKGYRVEQY